jgi:serine/threonine protein kinase
MKIVESLKAILILIAITMTASHEVPDQEGVADIPKSDKSGKSKEDPEPNPFEDLLTPEHLSYAKDPKDPEELYCSEIISHYPEYFCSQEGYFGRGGNGITFIVHNEVGKEFMLKVQEDSSSRGVNGLLDVQSHPNVIVIVKADSIGKHKVQIIEFADMGSLKSYFKGNRDLFRNDTYVFDFFSQIVSGIEHIHSRNIVHGDIKPANIVVDSERVPKIIDFDLCVYSEEKKGGRGTSNFMAPEVYSVWGKSKMYYNERVDVFSLGVTLYYLFTKSYPFSADDNDTVFPIMKRKTFLVKQGTRTDLAHIYVRSLRWHQIDRAGMKELKTLITSAIAPRIPPKTLRYDESMSMVGDNVFLEEVEFALAMQNEILTVYITVILTAIIVLVYATLKRNSFKVDSRIDFKASRMDNIF